MNEDWWKSFYDENLATMLLHPASGDECERTCDFLTEILELSSNDHVFDQCCGTGRIALALAERGYQVTGIDLAKSYIAEAKEALRPRTKFSVEDAFLYRTPTPCDAALNWWTSFGYAKQDQRNLQMLERTFESLKEGGLFALDYMNIPNLFRNFQNVVTTNKETEIGLITLHRYSKLDLHAGQLHKEWNYHLPDGQAVSHQTSTRLYTPDQLVTFFKNAGFVEIVLYGDLDASELSIESPRCIIRGRKPTL